MSTADAPPAAIEPAIRSLNRSFVSAGLFAFFTLAFVATPYWMISESLVIRIIFLLMTILLGLLWTRLSANELQLAVDGRAWVSGVVLLLLIGALNYRALTSAIPWRGDENYHIAAALHLAEIVPLAWAVAAIAVLLLILYVAWRKPKFALASAVLLAAGCVAVYFLRRPPLVMGILRYPFISRWFHALAPALVGPIIGRNREILFRLVPFLCAVILSWRFSRSVSSRSMPVAVALGLAAATIPEVFYYSSLLYLEMPAVVLMFLVCVQADQLLSLDFRDLTKTPSWYALILIGFIKETTVPFLLCFVVYRMVIQLSSSASRSSWKRLVLGELSMALCTLLPLFLYLFFRIYFGNPRTFDFVPANLLNLQAISITLLSHLEQFGLAYLLFIAGIVLLFRTKQHRQAVFLLLILICVPVFHLLDTVKYAGYSRFNLFVLPSVLAGAAVFLRFIGTKKKWYLPALAGLMIAANLAITPVNLDGTKNPSWGYPGESYYPFPEALSWLKDHHRPSRIVFAGMSVDYYFNFYFDRLDWHPQYERVADLRAEDQTSLQDALQTASEHGSTCMVVLPGENPAPPPQLLGAAGKWQLKVFRNMAYSLFVYTLD